MKSKTIIRLTLIALLFGGPCYAPRTHAQQAATLPLLLVHGATE